MGSEKGSESLSVHSWKTTLSDHKEKHNEIDVLNAVNYHWREMPQALFLSRQIRVFATKHVATNIILSRRTTSILNFSLDVFCCDKHVFVATKIILVAAPTNDSKQ